MWPTVKCRRCFLLSFDFDSDLVVSSDCFLAGKYCLFLQVAWFFKNVRVVLNACIIWPSEEFVTDVFQVIYFVTSSRNWLFEKLLLYHRVFVRSCKLFDILGITDVWQSSFFWPFLPVFWIFAVLSSWKYSGSPVFFHCVFCGNMFCLTNWTKLLW